MTRVRTPVGPKLPIGPKLPVVQKLVAIGAIAALPLLLAGCELGPKESVQYGPRGPGMEQVNNLNRVKAPALPPPSAYALTSREGQKAREVYPELKVLGDISIEEFGLLMANMTAWVVPADAPPTEAGCNYCHNPENMASYEKYTKTVSLSMLKMTQNINVNWQTHVKQTGVSCYTCHRGNAVPQYNWYLKPDPVSRGMAGYRPNQNEPSPVVGFASLPNDPNGTFLLNPREIRVNSTTIHPGSVNMAGTKDAEHTYGLMMRISGALGVNCTFCHNSQNFGEWNHSRLQKMTAWYGIRMVRQANSDYIQPLATVFPAASWNGARLGPLGDPLKVNCQTCHQGYSKPLGGVSMLADNPSLREIWRADEQQLPAPSPGPIAAVVVARAGERVVAAGVVATGAAAQAITNRVGAIRDATPAATPTG
jgi:photosynthetic reaction center cytochrome c subunit